jgi:hypothetical protein
LRALIGGDGDDGERNNGDFDDQVGEDVVTPPDDDDQEA